MKIRNLILIAGLTLCVVLIAACSSPAPDPAPVLNSTSMQSPVAPTQAPVAPQPKPTIAPATVNAPVSNQLSLAKQDNGKTFNLAMGGTLEVALEGNPGSTGYLWGMETGNAAILKSQGDYSFQSGSNIPGAAGKFSFKFTAVGTGTTTLRFANKRPWELNDAHAEVYAVTIQVPASAQASAVTKVTKQDSGKTIQAVPGTVVEIALDSNPTTGYSWQVISNNDAVLKQMGDSIFVADSNLTGAPGRETFRFQVVGAGTAALKMGYKQWWDTNMKPDPTFDLTVNAGSTQASAAKQVTKADKGKTIEIANGSPLQVVLEGAPGSTGYVWSFTSGNDAVLKPQFNPAIPMDSYGAGAAMPGAPGKFVYSFQATSAGSATLKFINKQPWVQNDPQAETFTVTVQVTGAQTTSAADPFSYCATVGNVDAPDARWTGAKMPDAVIAGLIKAAKISPDMPKDVLAQSSFWRCMNNKVYACTVGANLPCQEKADLNKTPTTAMNDYCKTNPAADIPAVVTGRATVYSWKCVSGKPTVDKELFKADARGFIADFWYEISK